MIELKRKPFIFPGFLWFGREFHSCACFGNNASGCNCCRSGACIRFQPQLRSSCVWRERGRGFKRYRGDSVGDRFVRKARGHGAASPWHVSERPSCAEEQHHPATRQGSHAAWFPDHADYPPKTEFREPGLQSLVSATNASNVSITGDGVIDGAGETWWQMARAIKNAGVMGSDHPRPSWWFSTIASMCASRELPFRTLPCGSWFSIIRRCDHSEHQGTRARPLAEYRRRRSLFVVARGHRSRFCRRGR